MATEQLQRVADWEREKEQRFARDFQLAQQYAQDNLQKLRALEQYRLDYLRQTQSKGSDGLGAQNFRQHQGFIGKLDKACEQQSQVHSQALLVADQRKSQWLQQQQKRKAVELLLKKKALARQATENRREQAALDEIALQRFVRSARQA